MANRRKFNGGLLASVAGALAAPRGRAADSPDRRVTSADAHSHVFRRDLPMVAGRRYTPDYDATPEKYLSELDRHQMSHGVLVQPSFLGTDNSYLLETLRAHRDRLRGVAVIDPERDLDKLDELNRAGVVGIRLNLAGVSGPGFPPSAWNTLLPRLKALDWHVELYVEAKRLKEVVEFPLKYGVNIVVDHFGWPDAASGVDDPGFRYLLTLGATRRVWTKISGAYRIAPGGKGEEVALQAIPLLRGALGLDHMLWGSDWPHTQFEKTQSYDTAYAFLHKMLPLAADRQTVLADAPMRVFHFGAAGN